MENTLAILLLVVIFTIWIGICVAVAKAAKQKNRNPGLWGFMTFIPLGPIMAPLWLASLPKSGDQASRGQLVGRTILIIWLIGTLGLRAAGPYVDEAEKKTVAKAQAEYGFETEYVSTHYRKMSVDEILECLSLNETIDNMVIDAEYDAAAETYYFSTQSQADIFNAVSAKYTEKECGTRTYDVSDLDKAMQIIEGGSNKGS